MIDPIAAQAQTLEEAYVFAYPPVLLALIRETVTNAEIHGYGGESGIITVEVETEGKELTVVVEDYGVGIRNVEKAMEPMFTTDKTGTRSGMGFSFMEAFMDQVHVESELGKGTKVIMRQQIGR